MRRRDALVVGGAIAIALAIPQILQRRTQAFEFTEISGLPGFRRLERGNISGGVNMFAGLETPEEAAASARLPANLCRAIFPMPVTPHRLPIAVFSDYYCPYCAVLDRRLADLQAGGAQIDVLFHELPLLGERSVREARVALAASLQTDHTAVHLDMMGRVLRPGVAGMRDLAKRHDLDVEKLIRDAADAQTAARLGEALALGRALGIPGTPGMMAGRTLVIGALSEKELGRLIALERATPFSGCGV